MKKTVTVAVPYARRLSYTLFSQGATVGIPRVDAGADFVRFTYFADSVFVLFYTFPRFRRAYVVTARRAASANQLTLPGVEAPLSVLFTARGRKIDHLKRALFLLQEADGYKHYLLPPLFWYRLSGLVQHAGAKKSDILLLYRQFRARRGNAAAAGGIA